MLIGLTGGIGSGKSTIARELEARGFAVYDCDREAKRIIATDKNVQQQIIALFGEEAFVNGVYNTTFVAKRAFSQKELLEQLNAIVHPAVKADIYQRSRSIFIESAILYESGLAPLCDKIFFVDAPEDLRIARTIARDYNGVASPDNINKVRARIRAQQSPSIHHPSPVLHINNDGNTPIPDLADQILRNI